MNKIRSKLIYKDDSDFSVTYKLNKINGIFNWYPYTEGFSKPFVDKMLDHFNAGKQSLILDPFSGCGTTALSCTLRDIPSLSIEVNPFMHFVGKAKGDSLKLDIDKISEQYNALKSHFKKEKPLDIPSFLEGKPFFNIENLQQALVIKNSIFKL